MIGTMVRVLILVAWVGLTGTYLARHILPGLGLTESSDPRSAIAARLGTVQRYEMRWRSSPGEDAQRVGQCTLATQLDDVGISLITTIDITDTRFVPGGRMIRMLIGGKRQDGIRLRMEEALDANMRLREVDVSGQIFGIAFSAVGPVDHSGLNLEWKVADKEGTTLIPEVRPERIAGNELGTGLPPGLKPGRTFTTRISTIDAARMRLAMKEAVFTVATRGPDTTAAGPAELMQVDMQVDGRRFASLWCDDAGTVHRQAIADTGLELHLIETTDSNGRHLWPPPADPDAQLPGTPLPAPTFEEMAQ